MNNSKLKYQLTQELAIQELNNLYKPQFSVDGTISAIISFNKLNESKIKADIEKLYPLTNTIQQIKNESFLCKPVKFIARVSTITKPDRYIIDEDLASDDPKSLNYIPLAKGDDLFPGNVDELNENCEGESNESKSEETISPIEIDPIQQIKDTLKNNKSPFITTFSIELEYQNANIKVMTLPANYWLKEMWQLLIQGQPVLFTGLLIYYGSGRDNAYTLYLRDVKKDISAYDYLNDRQYSLQEIKDKVEDIVKNNHNGIRAYIKQSLIEQLGIRGIEKAKELSKALDFIILQSLSSGRSKKDNYINKLHSLVIGPPASGKNFLISAASILNTIFYETSSSPDKLTVAGLVGTATKIKSGYKSSPGYLPKASNGVLCIQDFHEITRKGEKYWPIFSMVMQDGLAINSTVANIEFEAITSLHLDMNRQSQLKMNKSKDKLKDLNINTNIFSRLDFIIEIPEDYDRQLQVALDVAQGEKELGNSVDDPTKDQLKLKLKRMIAYLSTEYNYAKFDTDVLPYLNKKLKDILNIKNESDEFKNLMLQMMIRLVVSIKKLAKAIACAEMSYIITKEHIDEALDFINYKIKFLRDLSNNDNSVDEFQDNNKVQQRQNSIWKLCAGKTIKTGEILNDIKSLDLKVSDKTIERDLKKLVNDGKVKDLGYGKWEFLEE